MIKQLQILFILLSCCLLGKAGNDNNDDFQGDISSPAVRNNIKYNYDQIAGISNNKQTHFSDDFNLPQLRSIWQSNIDKDGWTLEEHPGFLRIKAQRFSFYDHSFTENSFYQRIKFNASGEIVSLFDMANLSENSNAGLFLASETTNLIGIETSGDSKKLVAKVNNLIFSGPVISENSIMLRIKFECNKVCFEYSVNGYSFSQLGPVFQISSLSNDFVGFYCLNEKIEIGSIDVDWFYCNPFVSDETKFAERENIFNSEL